MYMYVYMYLVNVQVVHFNSVDTAVPACFDNIVCMSMLCVKLLCFWVLSYG